MDHARSTSTLEDTLDDPWKATDIKPTGDLLSAASWTLSVVKVLPGDYYIFVHERDIRMKY